MLAIFSKKPFFQNGLTLFDGRQEEKGFLRLRCRRSVKGCRRSVKGCRHSVKGCRHSVKGCRRSVKGCRRSVKGYSPDVKRFYFIYYLTIYYLASHGHVLGTLTPNPITLLFGKSPLPSQATGILMHLLKLTCLN